MRVFSMALTAGVCLLAAGTAFAGPASTEVELCHDFAHGVSLYHGKGTLQGGTTFASLVESAGCENEGSDCVLQYCYGAPGADRSVSADSEDRLSQR